MKTLKNEKGLDLKPCLSCVIIQTAVAKDPWPLGWGSVEFVEVCPCPNHAGEIQREGDKITLFRCENRKMHQPPKIKKKIPVGTLTR